VLYEELGRTLATVPVVPTLLAAWAIEAAGDAQQRTQWLPRIAAGEIIASIALGDPGRPESSMRDGRLSCRLDHVLFGDVADLILVPVVDSEGASALAMISAQDAGVSVVRCALVDLTRSLATLTLEDVAVPVSNILRFDQAKMDSLRDHGAMALASDSVGGAAFILQRTVDYLGIREQFGRPIGSFQALKHRAAHWKIQLEAALALTRHVGDALDIGAPDGAAIASSAKFYAGDTYAAIAGDAVQLHGGIGFTWEHSCHLFLKRARLNQELFGSSAHHKDRVASLAFTPAAADAPAVAASHSQSAIPSIVDGASHGSDR
jgi:alkylation response protein AidB-like acyl-CoA dehydrogenase